MGGGGCEGVRRADHFHKHRESRAAVMELKVCAHHAFTIDRNLAIISAFLEPRRLARRPTLKMNVYSTNGHLLFVSGASAPLDSEAPNLECERVQHKGWMGKE